VQRVETHKVVSSQVYHLSSRIGLPGVIMV